MGFPPPTTQGFKPEIAELSRQYQIAVEACRRVDDTTPARIAAEQVAIRKDLYAQLEAALS